MAKKYGIFSSFYDVEEWIEPFNEYCETNGLDKNEVDIYDFIHSCLRDFYDDEVSNLDIKCGDIIAIADLGLWNGRFSAYKIITTKNVNGIFKVNTEDDCEFYCDQYNVKADIYHHDGCNHITFREIVEGHSRELERLKKSLYNQEEVTKEMIRRCTRSLRPYVKEVYGF